MEENGETKIIIQKERLESWQLTKYIIEVDLSDEDIEMMYELKLNIDNLSDERKLIGLGHIIATIKMRKEVEEFMRSKGTHISKGKE